MYLGRYMYSDTAGHKVATKERPFEAFAAHIQIAQAGLPDTRKVLAGAIANVRPMLLERLGEWIDGLLVQVATKKVLNRVVRV